MYVLIEFCEKESDPLGVFDSPEEVTPEKLQEYFGSYEEVSHLDIRDSGLEWTKMIRALDQNKLVSIQLTLKEFQLNVMGG